MKQGKTIDELSSVLINEEISLEEAREFIDELIENQVLVSELEPNVAGNDFLDSIIFTFKSSSNFFVSFNTLFNWGANNLKALLKTASNKSCLLLK